VDPIPHTMAWAFGIGAAALLKAVVGFASCKPADTLVFLLFAFVALGLVSLALSQEMKNVSEMICFVSSGM